MIWRYVGIDPGLAGGLGVYDYDPELPARSSARLFRTPVVTVKRGDQRRREYDERRMVALLRSFSDQRVQVELVTLELQQARPGQGVVSMHRNGFGFGLWLGLVAAVDRMPYQLVAPGVWKRHHGLLRCDKRASRLKAQQLFPELGAIAPADEGPAEGLLLAVYAARAAIAARTAAGR